MKCCLFYRVSCKWGMCSCPLAIVFEPSSQRAAERALGVGGVSETHSGQNLLLFWHKKVVRNPMYFCRVGVHYFSL